MINLFRDIILNNIKLLLGEKPLCAFWYDSRNWGDALNPVLIRHLSGKDPILITKYSLNLKNYPIYIAIGSILDHSFLGDKNILQNSFIWGAGFIRESGKLSGVPQKICAVRGPLTRRIILNQGIECPEVYGDPALLYPRFYKPKTIKRYKLGIIPHYLDKNNAMTTKFNNEPEVLLIDIEAPINIVVDQICSCKQIASSSLHGIVAADAYGVPSTWIKMSEKVVGDGFKFRDYFESVDRKDSEPLLITEEISIDAILETYHTYKIQIDLNQLLNACPFKADNF